MENALISYQFDEAPVRVVMVLDDPWFVANDIAKVLGYGQAAFMTRNLDEDEKGLHIVQTLGGNQELSIISESGLYAAIFKSRRAEAVRFRKWVTSEVLPTIRRTGKYHMHDEEMPTETGDSYDPIRLNAYVATIRAGLKLWGPDAARNMWIDLGLPLRIADARGQYRDGIAAPLKEWLAEHDASTTAEITGGIGLDPTSHADRKRVTSVLRLLGWWSKKVRRGADTTWAWFAPDTVHGEG